MTYRLAPHKAILYRNLDLGIADNVATLHSSK
jgi:hypothetical protein